MKEQPIIRSPYAIDPFERLLMTEKEKNMVYSNGDKQLSEPYTVIDVLQKVYHRDFKDDLTGYIHNTPHQLDVLKKTSDEWVMSECIRSQHIISPNDGIMCFSIFIL